MPSRDRVGKQRRNNGAVGEKIVTFEPGSADKKRHGVGGAGDVRSGGHDEERRDGGKTERRKDRRSASGNTFRRM